jgi:hypothetical protein
MLPNKMTEFVEDLNGLERRVLECLLDLGWGVMDLCVSCLFDLICA